MAVPEPAEQREVGVAVGDREPLLAEPGDGGVALGAQLVDLPQQLGRVPERRESGRLGDGREVVGQPHDADRVADRRVRGEVAQPQARGREGLAHRAGDDEVAVLGQELERARDALAAELAVRLVDDDDPVLTRGLAQQADGVGRQRRARRVVGARQQDDARSLALDGLAGGVDVEAEVVGAPALNPGGRGVAGVLRVHRVRRCEAHRRPPRATEGLEQLEHDLVGAVGRPHLLDGDPVGRVLGEVRRQRGAQLDVLAVGVAVERGRRRAHGRRDVVGAGVARAVGVLVGVELHGDVQLRRAVRLEAPQLLPDRGPAHRSNRTDTAAP